MLVFSLVQHDRADFAEVVKKGVEEVGIGAPSYCSDARFEHQSDRKLVRDTAWIQYSVNQSRLHSKFLLQSSIGIIEISVQNDSCILFCKPVKNIQFGIIQLSEQ